MTRKNQSPPAQGQETAATPARTVIHVSTQMQTVFGILDEAGNVIEKKSVTIEVGVLSPQVFGEAATVLLQQKEQLVAEIAKQPGYKSTE